MERNISSVIVVGLLIGVIGVSSVAVTSQMSYTALDSQFQELQLEYETYPHSTMR